MTQAFHVFANVRDLLEILILPSAEDWIIYNDTVDRFVLVCRNYMVFKFVTFNLPELKAKATIRKDNI
jgi:hypothetical protein